MVWRTRLSLLAAAFTVLGGFGLPVAADAVTLQCVPRETIFKSLKATNGEEPTHVGVTSSGALFEVLVSPDGSWTAFFTFPDGLTCPLATGAGWREVPQEDPAA